MTLSITLEYEERVCTGNYSYRHAKVTVHGSKDDIAAGRELAIQEVNKALGLVPGPAKVDLAKSVKDWTKLIDRATTPQTELNFPASDDIPGPKFFTDAELFKACEEKQASGTDPQKIRDLIVFRTGKIGKSVSSLKDNERERFMIDLAAL